MAYEILMKTTNHPASYVSQGVLWETRERAQQEADRLTAHWKPLIDYRIVEFDANSTGEVVDTSNFAFRDSDAKP